MQHRHASFVLIVTHLLVSRPGCYDLRGSLIVLCLRETGNDSFVRVGLNMRASNIAVESQPIRSQCHAGSMLPMLGSDMEEWQVLSLLQAYKQPLDLHEDTVLHQQGDKRTQRFTMAFEVRSAEQLTAVPQHTTRAISAKAQVAGFYTSDSDTRIQRQRVRYPGLNHSLDQESMKILHEEDLLPYLRTENVEQANEGRCQAPRPRAENAESQHLSPRSSPQRSVDFSRDCKGHSDEYQPMKATLCPNQ